MLEKINWYIVRSFSTSSWLTFIDAKIDFFMDDMRKSSSFLYPSSKLWITMTGGGQHALMCCSSHQGYPFRFFDDISFNDGFLFDFKSGIMALYVMAFSRCFSRFRCEKTKGHAGRAYFFSSGLRNDSDTATTLQMRRPLKPKLLIIY